MSFIPQLPALTPQEGHQGQPIRGDMGAGLGLRIPLQGSFVIGPLTLSSVWLGFISVPMTVKAMASVNLHCSPHELVKHEG